MYSGTEPTLEAGPAPEMGTSPGAPLTSRTNRWHQHQARRRSPYIPGQPLEDVAEGSSNSSPEVSRSPTRRLSDSSTKGPNNGEYTPPRKSWTKQPNFINPSTEALHTTSPSPSSPQASASASIEASQATSPTDSPATSNPVLAATPTTAIKTYKKSIFVEHLDGLNCHFNSTEDSGLAAATTAPPKEENPFFRPPWSLPQAPVLPVPADIPTPPDSLSTWSLAGGDSTISLLGRGYKLSRVQAVAEYEAIRRREAGRKEEIVDGHLVGIMRAVGEGNGEKKCRGMWKRAKNAVKGCVGKMRMK